MEKLLMLGTTPTSVELINIAKARGIYTIVTDYLEPEKSPAKLVSDEYWMISTSDIDALEQKCREETVTAVITGISENNLAFMAELSERLNLPSWCTPASWNAIQKKDQFKKLCREHGVPIAKDYYVSNPPTEEELDEIQFPVVVKPVDLNSAMGVSFCCSKEEVVKACEYARSLSSSKNVVIEEQLYGEFCMAHFALADGEISQFELVSNFALPGAPETCRCFTISTNNLRKLYEKNVLPAMKRLLKAAGCKDGVCWAQSFMKNGQFYTFEMGYRMPGDMINFPFVKIAGFDTLNWLLDNVLGITHTQKDLPVPRNSEDKACACAYIMWNGTGGKVQRIEGIEEIAAMPGVYVRPVIKEDTCVKPFTPICMVSFDADDQETAFDKMKIINKTIKYYDENGQNMLMYFEAFDQVRKVKAI